MKLLLNSDIWNNVSVENEKDDCEIDFVNDLFDCLDRGINVAREENLVEMQEELVNKANELKELELKLRLREAILRVREKMFLIKTKLGLS